MITFALFFLEIRWLSDVQSVRTSTIQGATNNYVKFEHYKRDSSEVHLQKSDQTHQTEHTYNAEGAENLEARFRTSERN